MLALLVCKLFGFSTGGGEWWSPGSPGLLGEVVGVEGLLFTKLLSDFLAFSWEG